MELYHRKSAIREQGNLLETIHLSNEQRISRAFGARDFVSSLGIFIKNSLSYYNNNDDLRQKISS